VRARRSVRQPTIAGHLSEFCRSRGVDNEEANSTLRVRLLSKPGLPTCRHVGDGRRVLSPWFTRKQEGEKEKRGATRVRQRDVAFGVLAYKEAES